MRVEVRYFPTPNTISPSMALMYQTELKRGQMGNIVLGLPMAPTAFRTLWKDDERFTTGYLDRFNGKWIDTGDAGMIDQDVCTTLPLSPS